MPAKHSSNGSPRPAAASSLRSLRQALLHLASSGEKSAERLRIAIYVLARARPNFEPMAQKDIMETLGLMQPNVSRSLSALSNDTLWLWRKVGRVDQYKLLPADAKSAK